MVHRPGALGRCTHPWVLWVLVTPLSGALPWLRGSCLTRSELPKRLCFSSPTVSAMQLCPTSAWVGSGNLPSGSRWRAKAGCLPFVHVCSPPLPLMWQSKCWVLMGKVLSKSHLFCLSFASQCGKISKYKTTKPGNKYGNMAEALCLCSERLWNLPTFIVI